MTRPHWFQICNHEDKWGTIHRKTISLSTTTTHILAYDSSVGIYQEAKRHLVIEHVNIFHRKDSFVKGIARQRRI
jgi:hypothetical protein